jgi:hypothetical protein
MRLLVSLVSLAATAFVPTSVSGSEKCNGFTLEERFARSYAVVLALVQEPTFPPNDTLPSLLERETAKLLVLKSWKGPYSVGDYISGGPRPICGGYCPTYPVHVGETFVVLSEGGDPVILEPCAIIDQTHTHELYFRLNELEGRRK